MAAGKWSHRKADNCEKPESPDCKVSLYSICYHIEDAQRNDDSWREFFVAHKLELLSLSLKNCCKTKGRP